MSETSTIDRIELFQISFNKTNVKNNIIFFINIIKKLLN